MRDAAVIFLCASVGAALQEVLYWYEIYKNLDFAKYRKLIQSGTYWVIVVAFIILTGIAAFFWFDDVTNQAKLRDVFIFGVSLPLIVKQLMRSRPEQIKLGGQNVSYFDVR